jgi:hypothetical protein
VVDLLATRLGHDAEVRFLGDLATGHLIPERRGPRLAGVNRQGSPRRRTKFSAGRPGRAIRPAAAWGVGFRPTPEPGPGTRRSQLLQVTLEGVAYLDRAVTQPNSEVIRTPSPSW